MQFKRILCSSDEVDKAKAEIKLLGLEVCSCKCIDIVEKDGTTKIVWEVCGKTLNPDLGPGIEIGD
jgi:hypothetical protein